MPICRLICPGRRAPRPLLTSFALLNKKLPFSVHAVMCSILLRPAIFPGSLRAGPTWLPCSGWKTRPRATDTFIDEHEAGKNMVFPRLLPALAYPARLVAAMYSSSFATLRTLMTGSAAPRVVHFRTRLKSDLARVVLAEAITFTPGTIVIDLDEDHLIVHWLNSTTRHSRRAGETVKGRLESMIGGMWV